MACLGLRTAGGISATRLPDRDCRFRIATRPNRVAFRPAAVVAKMAMVQCKEVPQLKAAPGGSDGGGRTDISGGPEKLDRWMRESVTEIVKNLEEAPLFVHVYGGDLGTRLKTEKAVAEDWTQMKGKWVKGEEPSPEGIILVEELKEDDAGILEEDEGQSGDCTKAWGVLIQGKGDDAGVACYLLKTCKVGGGGLGLFSTHYCLVRVKSFRETLKSQLTNCWLA